MDDGVFEREAELRVIAARLDAACAGDGSVVIVEGAAGIGKTTLVRAAVAMARGRGMTVLRGRGGVLEQDIEYGLVRQLVERTVLRAEPERRARLLAGSATPAAAVIGLAEPPAEKGPGFDPSPEILHALHWLTANLAEDSPLLVAIDDAHWGDAASMRAIGYVAARVADLPIAVLVGSRDDEPGSSAALLPELFHAAEPTYLRPAPFSEEAVGRVLSAAFGGAEPPPPLVQACSRASGGNPFFVAELAAELAAAHDDPGGLPLELVDRTGPVAVRRSLLLRLGRLGRDAELLARAVATLGGECDLRHAATVAGLEARAAARAADKLTDAKIAEGTRPLRLMHPLVRAAIADDTPESDRAAAHRRAFELLRAEGAADDATLPHALNAEAAGDPELVELLRVTAERALRSGAPATAAVHLRRALAEPPPDGERPELLAELGRAEVRQGAFEDGLAHSAQALALLDDPRRRLRLHRDRAFAAFAGMGMGKAREIVCEAAAELEGDDGALQLEADLALLAWLSGADHELDLRRHRDVPGETAAERTLLAVLAQDEHAAGAGPDVVVELATRALGGGG